MKICCLNELSAELNNIFSTFHNNRLFDKQISKIICDECGSKIHIEIKVTK